MRQVGSERVQFERGVTIVKKYLRDARKERRIESLAISLGVFTGIFGTSALLMLLFQV